MRKEANMDIKELATDLRDFEGVKRKAGIGKITKILGLRETSDFGDDTAILEMGGKTLLLACDNITERLIEADPYFAGYSAVLVNVNDIAAMGGESIVAVNTLSAKDEDVALEIAEGVKAASEKFGVPVVGGHFNSNSVYNGIAVAILGEAKKGIIRSSTAKPGQAIVAAIDLDGELYPSYNLAWDSTGRKSSERVRKNLGLLPKLAMGEKVRSGRDISNPGIVGTAGMLLEGSGVGGVIDIEKIVKPEEVSLSHWLKTYPGYGFVFTMDERMVEECVAIFEEQGIWAGGIGRVEDTSKLLIEYKGSEEVVFDFEKQGIIGYGHNR